MVELFNEVLGASVRLPERPRRIVSFSPAVTETLFEIGAGPSLVGVSAFCARPPEATKIRRVGSYNTVRPELLATLSPDLIFTVTGYQRDFAMNLSRDFPVYPLELPVSLPGIIDFVVKVGLVVGAEDESRELAGTLLRSLMSAKKSEGVRAYVEIDLGGPVAFGAHSYITDTLRFLGASSLYEHERCEWLTPSLDGVKSQDPDLVIYEPKMFSSFDDDDLRKLVRSRGWDGLRASRSGNIFVTPRPLDFLAHHGPSFITEAVPWTAETLERARRNL